MITILGIDAGGSRTTAAVADAGGRILARAEEGPGAIRPGGAQASADVMIRACEDALQRSRRSAPATVLVAGASGASHEAERAQVEQLLAASGLAVRAAVTSDAEIALAAAFGTGPGIVLIAGTGSIAWARLPDGTVARAGGLGPVLGDHGSGHDIGREALRAAALALETLGPATALAWRLPAHLGVEPGGLPRWAQNAAAADLAALAPVVLDVAKEKDLVARTIVRRSAQLLARQVAVLAERFPAGAPVAVAFGGGLLTKRKDYRRKIVTLLRRMAPAASPVRAPVDGVAGAIRIALAVRSV